MKNSLIYSYPLIIDLILGLFIFAGPMRAVEQHESLTMISLLLTFYGVGYVAFSLLMGKIVRVKYARRQIVIASLIISGLSTLMAFSSNSIVTLGVFMILPFATSLFFNAFQAFMKDVDSDRAKPLNLTVSSYIVSWSIGFALGPFFAGWLREYVSWSGAFAFAAALAIVVVIMAVSFRPGRDSVAPDPNAVMNPEDEPDFALSGWSGVLIGAMVLSLFLTLFPKQTELLGMRPGFRGMVIFLQNIVQAVAVVFYAKNIRWLFRASVAPFANALAIIALIFLFFAKSALMLFLSAILLGLYAATFFLAGVYHSLSHPSRSVRNIAINEASVGTGFLLGPQLIHLPHHSRPLTQPYLYAILLVVALIIFQYIFIKNRTSPSTNR